MIWIIFRCLECALTGELKITRLSTVVSSVAGNEDLFLFVEKVGKSEFSYFAVASGFQE